MADTLESDLESLLELASRRGPGRLDLLDPENIKKAAMLCVKSPKGFAQIEAKLSGWASKANWRKLVNKVAGDATDKRKQRQDAKEAEARLIEAQEKGLSIINFEEPTAVALDFITQRRPHLMHVNGEWLDYVRNRYKPLEALEVRAAMQKFLLSGVDAETGQPCKPNRKQLDDIIDALRNQCFRSTDEARPPSWLDPSTEQEDPDPRMCIACRNGILDAATGNLLPHTYRFFTRNGLDVDYEDPVLCDLPRAWLAFLRDIWPGERGPENIAALQEVFGYLLTGKTEYQKIFVFSGPPGAGKGTINRVLTALAGSANIVGTSIDALGKQFGLAPLIDKQIMVDADLRLGRESNIGGIVANLLKISGEDEVTIDRKFLPSWTGRLSTRIVLFSNMDLTLPDQAGALKRRYFPFVLRNIVPPDKVDTTLDRRLLAELPEIFNWAIAGLRRLEARRYPDGRPVGFVLTRDGEEMLAEVNRRSSTVKAFLTEVCDVGPDKVIDKNRLFEAFEGWLAESSLPNTYVHEQFTKELRAASGYNIEPTRLRLDGGERQRVYKGVDLKPEFAEYEWEANTDFS